MFGFLQSKKGFTIVELLIVLVLLSFGAFAVINLAQAAWRSFNKSEERYLKQEAVKEVVNKLQGSSTNVAAAEIAAIYDDLKYVEDAGYYDPGYSYLYAKPDTFNINGVETTAYRLFYRNANASEGTPVLSQNSEYYNYPVYILFEALKTPVQKVVTDVNGDPKIGDDGLVVMEDVYESENVKKMENSCGAKVRVMAMENNTTEFISDNVFYELDVTYHFPNMATHGTGNKINISAGSPMDGTTDNGIVLKIHVDSIIKGNNSEVAPSMSCYIATASYGWDSGEVGLLCDFRDTCLLTNAPGRLFVKTYYAISPPIADFIAQHETLRAAVRTMLKPLIVVAEYSLNPELISEVAPTLIVAFALGLPLSATAVVINKKRKRGED